jgi:hypothetical protein
MKVCPQCRKVSYINNVALRSRCQHCGFPLNTWTEKRAYPRIVGHYKSRITTGDNLLDGHCVDISYDGFRIVYRGKAIDKGTLIEIEVDELNARGKAEVVWSSQHSLHTAHIGVKII